MGLKMPSDEDVLANKIFLNRASVRNKAKSWLNASSGAEVEQSSLSSLSKSNEDIVLDDLSTIRASDELSGVGIVSKSGDDDPTNRQLMSANDALRRKLLSKQAYQRYNEGKKHGVDTARPAPRKRELDDEDYEEAGKGKSIRQLATKPSVKDDGQEAEETAGTLPTVPKPSIKTRKRPSSYLDQLLADRKGKQQKKAKKSDNDD